MLSSGASVAGSAEMPHDDEMSIPEPTGRRNRGLKQSVGDMLRSMVVVLAVVGAILLVTWRPQPAAVKAVTLEPLVTLASGQASFPVLVVDFDAQPTSVRWESTPASDGEIVWHVGYVTDEGEYLQLSQSSAEGDLYVEEQTSEGVVLEDFSDLPALVQTLTAEGWVPLEGLGDDGRRSLVRTNDGSTTVISGTGSWGQVGDAARNLVLP